MAQLPTVLIVDDDPGIRKMIAEVLTLEGIPYKTAGNGQEALDILANSDPLIVLLDLLMPIKSGRDVMEELQAVPAERAKHKIILVSALTNLESSRDLEADNMLPKPFTVPQLLNMMETVSTKV
jgi:two-component system response regulator (stage 0 sporulation protein F)